MPETSRRLRWVVSLAGLLLLAVLLVELGPARIGRLFLALGWNFPVVCALFALHEAVRALALDRCLLPGHRPPFRLLLRVRFLGEALRTLTHSGPFLSEPARAWMLARDAAEGADGFGAAVSELLAATWISAAVGALVLGLALQTSIVSPPLVLFSRLVLWASLAFVTVAAVAVIRRVYVIGGVVRVLGALPIVGGRLRADPRHVRRMEDAILFVLRERPGTLLQILALECLAQTVLVAEIGWTLRSMGYEIAWSRAWFVEAVTKVVNLIQFVGAAEGGFVLVFNWLEMTAAAGFTLSLVKRARSLVASLAALAVLRWYERHLGVAGQALSAGTRS